MDNAPRVLVGARCVELFVTCVIACSSTGINTCFSQESFEMIWKMCAGMEVLKVKGMIEPM